MNTEWVTQLVRLHPASFREAFPKRRVNNVYFDTPTLDCFKENAAGVAERKKHRLRWYGEQMDFLENPVFEIKIKDRELGYKKSQPLASFQWADLKTNLANVTSLKDLPLQPILINSYQRAYYLSQDRQFRITIDHDLSFAPFQWDKPTPKGYPSPSPAVVLELKYEAEHDELAQNIFDHLPFRQTKNSKFMEGINLILG